MVPVLYLTLIFFSNFSFHAKCWPDWPLTQDVITKLIKTTDKLGWLPKDDIVRVRNFVCYTKLAKVIVLNILLHILNKYTKDETTKTITEGRGFESHLGLGFFFFSSPT